LKSSASGTEVYYEYLHKHNNLLVKYSSLSLLWCIRALGSICRFLRLMALKLWFRFSLQNSEFYVEWSDV